ncbi:MAG: N(4)-(beta-N-acetylglucosaminyl)-L-asparaginase [Phycisphaerae bacterium]|nr:N(4)-(beta-N-acetylglucosaminyl)-L-asparaginase [Phycisphaerae bacterium]
MPTQPPILVASWNGAPATRLAAKLHAAGIPMLDAIVEGIGLVEDDPEELSVGYGGLPNEEGEVELDAAVMDGPRHKAGAVAGLRRYRRAAAVAREVLRRTDHALLVGEGASRFARQCGFTEENLLTPKSREAWLNWKAELSPRDGWISPDESASDFGHARWAGLQGNPMPGGPPDANHPPRVPFTYGTIHVSGRDSEGNLYACTSTSGLSYKIPGRVGDSPLVGAGIYTDNQFGSAGATGRGESALHNCAAFDTVRFMESGRTATEACLEVLRRIAARTHEARLKNTNGQPKFNVTLYAIRKDGEIGAASMHEGYEFITQIGDITRTVPASSIFCKL